MSLFTLPRIHFWGTQKSNPGTANNDVISPGTEAAITSNTERVQPQLQGMDDDVFRKWIASIDETGNWLRSQWNYFGDMGHQWLDVQVRSVQLGYDHVITDPAAEPMIGGHVDVGFTTLCDNNPEDFNSTQMFTEALVMRAPGALGGSGAFVSRKPTCATTRSLNWYRNVSYHGCLGEQTSGGAGGASATFHCAMPVEKGDLKPAHESGTEYDTMLHRFLANPNSPGAMAMAEALARDDVQGLVLRYNLYLCYPRISDTELAKEFAAGRQTENPAIGWVVGTIAPWLVGDAESISMGRFLKPAQSYVNPYRTDNKPYFLAPVVVSVDADAQWISIDAANTFPEDGRDGQKYTLGKIELGVRTATAPNADPMSNDSEFIVIGELKNDKQSYETRGGMIDVPYGDLSPSDRTKIEDGEHELVIRTALQGLLLYEPEYMVVSDVSCHWVDEPAPGQDWDDVRATLDAQPFPSLRGRVPLVARRRGKVPTKPIKAKIEQWKQSPTGDPKNFGFFQYPILLGVDEIEIDGATGSYPLRPSAGSGARIYRLIPEGQWPQQMTPQTADNSWAAEYIFSCRVLPYDDYSHIATEDLDFDVIYREVFRYYSLIFPTMTRRLDLGDPTIWQTPTAARYLMKTTDISRWQYYDYMPRTRDLSAARRALLHRFANKILSKFES